MESLLKSDIFFFITSIAVILCTVVFIIAGYYVIKTAKNMADISESLKKTVKDVGSDIGEISNQVRESQLFTFIFGKGRKNKKESK